jgi:cell division initiation protein
MRITPLDVRKQEFRKGMRGLDPEEVYAFLSTVADEYEAVLNDNKALRERLLELDDKVQEYRTMEKTLRDTLLTAERVNVEAKDNARREANIIIKEAQIEAEKALRDIKTEAMKLRSQVQQLHSQRDAYLARMRVVAESHLSYIESAVEDFTKEDRTISELDLSEEQLADAPTDDTNETIDTSSESDLFEAAKDVAARDPRVTVSPEPEPRASAPTDAPAAKPAEPAPSTPRTPPIPPVDTAGRDRQRQAPTAQAQERTTGPATGQSAGGVDPISVIIDRMKKGQQEILSSGAGTPGITEAPEVTRPLDPVPAAGTEKTEPTTIAVAPPLDEGEETVQVAEVTGEFNLDDLRRKLQDGDHGG